MTDMDLKYQDLKKECEELKKENKRLKFANEFLEIELKEHETRWNKVLRELEEKEKHAETGPIKVAFHIANNIVKAAGQAISKDVCKKSEKE